MVVEATAEARAAAREEVAREEVAQAVGREVAREEVAMGVGKMAVPMAAAETG